MSSHQSTYIIKCLRKSYVLPTPAATYLAVNELILSTKCTNCKYFKILCIFKSGTDKIPLSRFQTKPNHSKLLCGFHTLFHNSAENPPTTNLSKLFQTCNYTIPQNQQTRDHHLDIQLLKNPLDLQNFTSGRIVGKNKTRRT